jgi:carbamoyl-phosphate synthase large subunit
MEHIEEAGIHSGDSACVFAANNFSASTWPSCVNTPNGSALAWASAAYEHPVRDQRRDRVRPGSQPARFTHRSYASKATGLNLAQTASLVMAGMKLADLGVTEQPRWMASSSRKQ